MVKYKVYSIYVILPGGANVFDMEFAPMPASALIAAMITAMQSFIYEVSGKRARKIAAGDFVFHIENIGDTTIVLATSSEEKPAEMTDLRNTFFAKFGSKLKDFLGDTAAFEGFETDVRQILDLPKFSEKVFPEKKLTPYALLQIDPELQTFAKEIVMHKEVKVKELMEKFELPEVTVKLKLERLFELGFIGRMTKDYEFIYFT